LLELNKEYNESKNKFTDKTGKLEEEIKSLEKELNDKVYKIYGITEDEKKVIEESFS